MKQLSQKLKDGHMQVLEVPVPAVAPGNVLVQTRFSLVSVGTEGRTVKTARSSLLDKAKQRPQQAKQVIDTLKSQGPVQTYRAVMKKLDAYSPLGYSACGKVIGTGDKVQGLKDEDLVACGGLTANHAEIVNVPENLCVKLHPDADLRHAAFNTLGAIALQGVRQADLRLGETCAVIGLGLIGQLAALLLRASGIRAVGIDIDPAIVKIAGGHCLDLALTRDDPGIESKILDYTEGLGCDAVIITAASKSLDPINFAGAIARKKGTVVVVGEVPTGFDREPHFYKKELQVRMSCSYGPGRYDATYEEKGIDYPPAYVRWTEKRNMQAFQDLLYSKKIDVSHLITHTFKLEDAPSAYDMILARSEPFLGILIEYDTGKKIENRPIFLSSKLEARSWKLEKIGIAFIGAGSYAQSHLLPNIPKGEHVMLKGVMTATGTSSRSVAERFGFEFCTSNLNDILENNEINTVFIATRHDSHADYVIKALKAEKHVFVEKPLCLTEAELNEITTAYNSVLSTQSSPLLLMVGYNRRFSPLTQMIKDQLGDGPMAMTYRINAGKIPSDSWIQDAEIGGGRIVGEVCHFVDFLTYINGSLPVSVYAAAMVDPNHLNDTLNVSLAYQNGSIGTISYFANGDKRISKERVEIFAYNTTAVIDDFKRLAVYAGNKKQENKLMRQDKGQKAEVTQFIDSLLTGKKIIIPFSELYSTSLVCFRIKQSLRSGQCMQIGH